MKELFEYIIRNLKIACEHISVDILASLPIPNYNNLKKQIGANPDEFLHV